MEEKYNKVLGIFDELDDTSKCPIIEEYKSGFNCDTNFKYKLDK
jgi:hypothetical protein